MKNRVFLLKIAPFQAVITWSKLDQSWTYYSVLESAECVQQYAGQKNVIYETVWPGGCPTQNKETAIKICHFQGLITVDCTCLFKKPLTCKKTLRIILNILTCNTLSGERH
jgi:hypothetical protein